MIRESEMAHRAAQHPDSMLGGCARQEVQRNARDRKGDLGRVNTEASGFCQQISTVST
jgi:hypothetical protein